jgi:hypothetical protein
MKLSVKIKVAEGAVRIFKYTVIVPLPFRKMCKYIHSYMYVWNPFTFMFLFGYIFQSCESILAFSSGSISPNPRTIMSDKYVLKSHEVLPFHKTEMPKLVLQRAEEIFPALKETMVSVVCMK